MSALWALLDAARGLIHSDLDVDDCVRVLRKALADYDAERAIVEDLPTPSVNKFYAVHDAISGVRFEGFPTVELLDAFDALGKVGVFGYRKHGVWHLTNDADWELKIILRPIP